MFRTIIVLGSGGHTAEIAAIVKDLDKTKYTPRHYLLAKTDATSRDRLLTVEGDNSNGNYEFHEIFRSRNVKQSYLTSVFTTIVAILSCIPIVWRVKPHLVLCNGPGTCVPVCVVAYIFSKLHLIPKCKIVFVESFCRVKSLSLSGEILLRIADLFVVQWPQLMEVRQNVRYFGKLV